MILTDHFVFIHQPKTGGTFVSAMLEKIFAPKNRLSALPGIGRSGRHYTDTHAHETVSQIPESHRDKPIIATVRNPLDRYVSQYEFPWWKTRNDDVIDVDALRSRYPHFPELTFPEFMSVIDQVLGIRQPGADHRSDVVGFQTNQFIRFFFHDAERVLGALDDAYIDDGRWREDLTPIVFLRTHRLNEDLHRFLSAIDELPRDPSFILDAAKVLPKMSQRTDAQDWHSYYDHATFEAVRSRDRMLFDLIPDFDDGWRPAEDSS